MKEQREKHLVATLLTKAWKSVYDLMFNHQMEPSKVSNDPHSAYFGRHIVVIEPISGVIGKIILFIEKQTAVIYELILFIAQLSVQ